MHHSPKSISYLETCSSNSQSCQQVPPFFPQKIFFTSSAKKLKCLLKNVPLFKLKISKYAPPPIEQIRDRSALKGNACFYLNILFYLNNYLYFLSRNSDVTGTAQVLVCFSFMYVIIFLFQFLTVFSLRN